MISTIYALKVEGMEQEVFSSLQQGEGRFAVGSGPKSRDAIPISAMLTPPPPTRLKAILDAIRSCRLLASVPVA